MKLGHPDETCESLCFKAEALMDLGRNREAIPLLEKASGMEPQNPVPLCLASNAFFDLGDLPRSLQFAKAALGVDAEFDWAIALLAQAYFGVGKYVEGRRALDNLLRVNPNSFWGIYTLIECQLAEGKKKEAVQTSNLLLSKYPNQAGVYLKLARVCRHFQNPELEREYLLKALALDAELIPALHYLGVVEWSLKNHLPAVEALFSAVMLAPELVESRKLLDEFLREIVKGVFDFGAEPEPKPKYTPAQRIATYTRNTFGCFFTPLLVVSAFATALAIIPVGFGSYRPILYCGSVFIVSLLVVWGLTYNVPDPQLARLAKLPPRLRQYYEQHLKAK